MPEYPEHEKLQKVSEESNSIGQFLEWLNGERGLTICQNGIMDERPVYWTRPDAEAAGLKWAPWGRDKAEGEVNEFTVREYEQYEREGFYPAGIGIENLLAEYFNIDLKKISAEKDAILEDFRARTAANV